MFESGSLMTSHNLSMFFRPQGVAVIGASREPGKLGHDAVRNLVQHRYDGPIYPVNPHADEVFGRKAYPSILDVPNPVDLAIVVVPAKHVASALEACGQRGIKGVIVVSGGFREVGPEGVEREAQIKRIIQQYDIALIGPNCIGTIDTHTPLNTTFVKGHPRAGEIALVSQSGAVAAAVIDWATGSGVGFSRIVSLGNQAGVTEAAIIEPIANDPYTRVVTAYIEGVSDGQAFLEAASRVAKEKPVIALKVGRGASGAKAVASHTGALAGAEAAYDAAFRRAGVLRASTFEEMLDWARALAWQPLPKGNRVAVLTNAGGLGVMAVDALEAEGMQLAPLTDKTRSFLRQRVPPAASVQNPIDILAGSGPATYALCLDALLDDETVDAMVVMTAPQDWFEPSSLAEVVGEVGSSPLGRRKPILAVIMGLGSTPENDATQVLHRRHIPNFTFPERIGSTMAAMWQRQQWLDSLADRPPALALETCDGETIGTLMTDAEALVRQRMGEGLDTIQAGWMQPDSTETLLKAYCIGTPGSTTAADEKQALTIAGEIGYPVALKLAVKGLSHKTDVGGVRLGIATPEALKTAFGEVMQQAKKLAPDSGAIEGVTIQKMISGAAEVIVGIVRDPQFGPLVMVGSGGTQVELLRDVTFELAPVSRQQADDMLNRTTVGRLLAGYRGKPPADRDAVIDTIQRLAQVALDFPQIAEIEINPLIVMPDGDGAYAVDARVRLEIKT
jgi:acetyl coenzyme A synthetase (ADP forming)-like protein